MLFAHAAEAEVVEAQVLGKVGAEEGAGLSRTEEHGRNDRVLYALDGLVALLELKVQSHRQFARSEVVDNDVCHERGGAPLRHRLQRCRVRRRQHRRYGYWRTLCRGSCYCHEQHE